MSELLEKILDKENMNEAYKKVCTNKGAGGVVPFSLIYSNVLLGSNSMMVNPKGNDSAK